MSKYRNRVAGAAVAALAMTGSLILAGPGPAWSAEKAQTKKSNDTEKARNATKKPPSTGAAKETFRPQEKISAGKPVSFPSDI